MVLVLEYGKSGPIQRKSIENGDLAWMEEGMHEICSPTNSKV